MGMNQTRSLLLKIKIKCSETEKLLNKLYSGGSEKEVKQKEAGGLRGKKEQIVLKKFQGGRLLEFLMKDILQNENVCALVGVGWHCRTGWWAFNTTANVSFYIKGHKTLNASCFVMLGNRMSKIEKSFMHLTRLETHPMGPDHGSICGLEVVWAWLHGNVGPFKGFQSKEK